MKHIVKQGTSHSRTYLDGLALGAFLATIMWLIAHMWLDFGLSDENGLEFIGTIVVAVFSLGAALIALRGVRSQIAATQQIELERRDRALFAARAILAAELAPLFDVAINNIRLHFEHGARSVGSILPPVTGLKPMPLNITATFKEVIQNADPMSQDRLANILRHCQVFQARDEERNHFVIKLLMTDYKQGESRAVNAAIDWAVIYAQVADAIIYARGSCEAIRQSVDPDRVRGAFVQSCISLEDYPALDLILTARIQENRLELNWKQ